MGDGEGSGGGGGPQRPQPVRSMPRRSRSRRDSGSGASATAVGVPAEGPAGDAGAQAAHANDCGGCSTPTGATRDRVPARPRRGEADGCGPASVADSRDDGGGGASGGQGALQGAEVRPAAKEASTCPVAGIAGGGACAVAPAAGLQAAMPRRASMDERRGRAPGDCTGKPASPRARSAGRKPRSRSSAGSLKQAVARASPPKQLIQQGATRLQQQQQQQRQQQRAQEDEQEQRARAALAATAALTRSVRASGEAGSANANTRQPQRRQVRPQGETEEGEAKDVEQPTQQQPTQQQPTQQQTQGESASPQPQKRKASATKQRSASEPTEAASPAAAAAAPAPVRAQTPGAARRGGLAARLPATLTPELLQRFGLGLEADGETLAAISARQLEALRCTVPEVVLGEPQAAAAAAASAGVWEAEAWALAAWHAQQLSEWQQQEEWSQANYSHHNHHHSSHQHHRQPQEWQQHWQQRAQLWGCSSFDAQSTLSERSAPPAPLRSPRADGPCACGGGEVASPRRRCRGHCVAASAASDRSDAASDPGACGGEHSAAREAAEHHATGAAAGADATQELCQHKLVVQQLLKHQAQRAQQQQQKQQQKQQQQQQQQQRERQHQWQDQQAALLRTSSGSAALQSAVAAAAKPLAAAKGHHSPLVSPAWDRAAALSRLSPLSLPAPSPCYSSPGTPPLPPSAQPPRLALPPAALAGGGAPPKPESPPAAVYASPPAGRAVVSDVERFLAAASPPLQLAADGAGGGKGGALASLTLGAVWEAFTAASLAGAPVATRGGARGPATAYFVPYLSAIQVFLEPGGAAGACAAAGGPEAPVPPPAGVANAGRLYSCAVDGWPPALEVLCEYVEHELPFHREPLSMQLEAMAAAQHAGAASARPPAVGPALAATRLADLHPASWFAAAWYPLYSIPEAPLRARFLVFYSLGAVRQLLDAAAAEGRGGGAPAAALRELRLPIIGLQWCDAGVERWFEAGLPRGGQLPRECCEACRVGGGGSACGSGNSSSGRDSCSDASAEESDGGAAGGDAPWAWGRCGGRGDESSGDESSGDESSGKYSAAASVGRCSRCAAGAPLQACGGASSCSDSSCWSPLAAARGAARLRDALSRLQASAERLARGSWLTLLDPVAGPRPFRLYHSDFEFFHSRS